MSLKNIKDNSELVNAFNNFCIHKDEYMNLADKHKTESKNLKNAQLVEIKEVATQLKASINTLTRNDSFNLTATQTEKKEIQKLLAQVDQKNKIDQKTN